MTPLTAPLNCMVPVKVSVFLRATELGLAEVDPNVRTNDVAVGVRVGVAVGVGVGVIVGVGTVVGVSASVAVPVGPGVPDPFNEYPPDA